MRRKTMVLAGIHWFILVLCHIVLCSHSLRHHRGHSATLSSGGGESGEVDGSDPLLMDSANESVPSNLSPNLYYKPGIVQMKVKPGHELKIKCELNNTYGRIMWLLNGKAIRTDNGRFSIQGPNLNRAIEGRLTINNILPEDNGIWQCHETKFLDSTERVSKPILVIVLAAPRAVHLEFDGRRASPSSPSSTRVTYREKENISIQCVVEGGNPPPNIYWFMNSQNLTNSSDVSATYLDDDKLFLTRSTLLLQNVSRSFQNKSVVCIVDHEMLASASQDSSYLRATVHFNIEYSPSFIISRIPPFGYPLREGISAALKCDIDANPWSPPFWMKDGELVGVSEDGFLNFTSLNRSHSGWYKCGSHHPMGESSSVGYLFLVRYEPTIVHQPPKRIEANVGDKVKMNCEADGQPSPGLCWSRIGYGGSLTSVGSGQELILNNILYQEAGNYRCVAQNRLGHEERRAQTHDVQVVVTGRPVVYPTNRTIMAFAGQPLSLSLELCANPKPERSFWVFGNTALKPGSRHRNKYVAQKLSGGESADCYLAVLTILNVSSEDAGEYMFFVKNNKGLHEGTILLNITQASYSVSSSRAYTLFHSPLTLSISTTVVLFISTWLSLITEKISRCG